MSSSASVRVKFCGLTQPRDVLAATRAGASYLGFVFFAKSPRNIAPAGARALALDVAPGIAKVALVVDADDRALDEILATVPIDILQLHGKESPERVAVIKARTGLPVMKAVGLRDAADLPALDAYGAVADMLLVDAKPPRGADLPGGNGVAFDWRLVAGRRWPVPWMLAGGLTPDNVAEAIRLTGARQVDVSSGVESAPGIKDPALMAAFGAAVRGE
ncbi:MAG: phosphoribosylanthranilate isomerase [Qingshengfaniella sp.]